MSWSGPLLERLAADPGLEIAEDAASAPDADRVVAAIERAASQDADENAWRALDEVADLHDPETLDDVLSRTARRGGLPFVGRGRRRRVLDIARGALAGTRKPGTLRLAAALLGAVGSDDDVASLETIAAHPAFTLHGATALADRASQAAIGALLRLLSRTDGAERVLVMDRLLVFIRQPVVRLALIRDAFTGLADEHAVEIAPIVIEELDVAGMAADPATPERLRKTARRLLRLCGQPVPPHDLVD